MEQQVTADNNFNVKLLLYLQNMLYFFHVKFSKVVLVQNVSLMQGKQLYLNDR